MFYSNNIGDCRVDIFEKSKWFRTMSINMTDFYLVSTCEEALQKAIKKQTNHEYLNFDKMVAVCLHPYHQNPIPTLIEIIISHKDRIQIGIDKLRPYLTKLDLNYPYDCDGRYYLFIRNHLEKYFVNDIIDDEIKKINNDNDLFVKLAKFNVPETITSIDSFYDIVQHSFDNFLAAIICEDKKCSEDLLINAEDFLIAIKQSKFADNTVF